MTAPELTEAEAAIVARFEAADPAPESWHIRQNAVTQVAGRPTAAVDLDALGKLRSALAVMLTGFHPDTALAAADALLPVVDRIANERAAAELRAAADDQDASTNHICDSPRWLRDRADELDGDR